MKNKKILVLIIMMLLLIMGYGKKLFKNEYNNN